jgi:hypothetical protein
VYPIASIQVASAVASTLLKETRRTPNKGYRLESARIWRSLSCAISFERKRSLGHTG